MREKQVHILKDIHYYLFGSAFTDAMIGTFKIYQIKVSPELRMLEAGCGHGKFVYFWSQFGCKCWGVDIDPKQIDFCRKISDICDKIVGIRGYYAFSEEDIRELPYEDGSFDVVFNEGVLEHFDKKTQMIILREMVRVSKNLVMVFVPDAENKEAVDFAKKTKHYGYEGKGGMGLKEKPIKSTQLTKMLKETGLKNIKYSKVKSYILGVGQK
jgi:ubiquinone/menaquinone biosynthesis C-methylase UbiE